MPEFSGNTCTWFDVENAVAELRAFMAERIGTRQTDTMMQTFSSMREAPNAEPDAMMAYLIQLRRSFEAMPPAGAPFSLAVCKGIAEASAVKLSHLGARVRFGRAPRGLERTEAEAIGAHADALIPSFGDEPELVIRIAYQNILTFSRHLIFGQVFNRNELKPITALAEAFSPYAQQPDCAPAAVVPGRGVILAVGPSLVPSLASKWTPHRLIFRGFKGEVLHLDRFDELGEFLSIARPRITPRTLASLLHIMLSPFEWTQGFELEETGLLREFEPLESKLEDQRLNTQSASALLGLNLGDHEPEREALIVRVGKTTLIYRSGELFVD